MQLNLLLLPVAAYHASDESSGRDLFDWLLRWSVLLESGQTAAGCQLEYAPHLGS